MAKGHLLIIGGGLAGCSMAITAHFNGYAITLVDDHKGDAASAVAAGLINPITGSRFVKTWLAESVTEAATRFYSQASSLLGKTFYHQQPIVRPFGSIEEQNMAIAKSSEPDYAKFITSTDLPAELEPLIQAPLGAMQFGHGGWVDVPLLLSETHRWLTEIGAMQIGTIHPEHLTLAAADQLEWKGQLFDAAVFCNGYRAAKHTAWQTIKFSPVRGELLHLKPATNWSGFAVSKGIYCLTDGDMLKVGATYNWREPTPETSDQGLKELLTDAKSVLKTPFEVVGHYAGVRPAIADRRPVAGKMPECSGPLFLLNGLGSKGCSLAPFLAEKLLKLIFEDAPMPVEVDPSRFLRKQHVNKAKPQS